MVKVKCAVLRSTTLSGFRNYGRAVRPRITVSARGQTPDLTVTRTCPFRKDFGLSRGIVRKDNDTKPQLSTPNCRSWSALPPPPRPMPGLGPPRPAGPLATAAADAPAAAGARSRPGGYSILVESWGMLAASLDCQTPTPCARSTHGHRGARFSARRSAPRHSKTMTQSRYAAPNSPHRVAPADGGAA